MLREDVSTGFNRAHWPGAQLPGWPGTLAPWHPGTVSLDLCSMLSLLLGQQLPVWLLPVMAEMPEAKHGHKGPLQASAGVASSSTSLAQASHMVNPVVRGGQSPAHPPRGSVLSIPIAKGMGKGVKNQGRICIVQIS